MVDPFNGKLIPLSQVHQEPAIKLVDNVVKSLRVAKIFRENDERINHMDFSASGDLLISSADDDQIIVYDCEKGDISRTILSKKYGVNLIRYTHSRNNAIHSSTKLNDTVRYLSLHDNKYLRYFTGHTKRVTTLSMSPVDDTFLSGSLDKQLRLWDLRAPTCHGLMDLEGTPVADFDPEGLVFAAGVNSEVIKLYDLRSFHKGPFSTFNFSYERQGEWTSLKFSPDGTMLMVCSDDSSAIRIIHSFYGNVVQTFVGHVNTSTQPLEACFSNDSQYVFCGSSDGKVHVWNVEHGNKVCVFDSGHPGPITSVKFNPKSIMMATTCANMALWLPAALK